MSDQPVLAPDIDLAVKILILEVVVLFLVFLGILFIRFKRHREDRNIIENREKLSQILADGLQKNRVIENSEIPPKLQNYQILLATLEAFNRNFRDRVWQQTRLHLIDGFLLPKVKGFLTSKKWQNQLLGLRCIALDPKRLMDDELVIPLLDSHSFLVRVTSATCMVHSDRKELLMAVVNRILKEAPLARYPFRDLLVTGSAETFKWIEEIALSETNPEIIALCLDVLSTKMGKNLLPLAAQHIHSEDRNCRLTSIKIFSNIPSEESKHFLSECLNDSDSEIRAEAARGLGNIKATSQIPQLTQVLNDPDWFVRLQAALALKAMGGEGRSVLFRQDVAKSPAAHEVAQYVMALP